MKRFLFLFLAFILSSCSGLKQGSSKGGGGKIGGGTDTFFLKDRTGEFIVARSVKSQGKKLVVKKEVFLPSEMNNPVEKTISVSDAGAIKTKSGQVPSLRPNVSQHTIWYEKERFFSQLKVNLAKRTLDVVMESPEKKWSGARSYKFPKGKVFCFFSQMPECAKAHGLLGATKKPVGIQVIWDNFPYHQEMYENVSADPFESATWAFDKTEKGLSRYGLIVGGQLVIYEFDSESDFKNMYWIAQGIALSKEKE